MLQQSAAEMEAMDDKDLLGMIHSCHGWSLSEATLLELFGLKSMLRQKSFK